MALSSPFGAITKGNAMQIHPTAPVVALNHYRHHRAAEPLLGSTEQGVAMMLRYGSNGMKKLAAAWLALDADRRAALESALADDFMRHRRMAAHESRLADLEGRN